VYIPKVLKHGTDERTKRLFLALSLEGINVCEAGEF
jgi:hypothetical protein